MATITINGVAFTGSNISINNGHIDMDGKDVTPKNSVKIDISIQGNVDNLEVDACNEISVNGNVHMLRSGSGDVVCENVTSNVQSGSGDIIAKNVGGSIQTGSGDVSCEEVKGSVRTGSGDIKHK